MQGGHQFCPKGRTSESHILEGEKEDSEIMADVDEETIEEIFNAELERLQAAMEELDLSLIHISEPTRRS